MDKIKYFHNKVLELSSTLRIEIPYVRQDNRLGGYIASICEGIHIKTKKKAYFLTYNSIIIEKLSKWMIVHSILHEFGHIKTNSKSLIRREYKAEKFALKAIKKYFPKYYKRSVDYVKRFVKGNIKIYDKAFGSLLKDINES